MEVFQDPGGQLCESLARLPLTLWRMNEGSFGAGRPKPKHKFTRHFQGCVRTVVFLD